MRKVFFLLIAAVTVGTIIFSFNNRLNGFESDQFTTSSQRPFEFAYNFAEALRNNDPIAYNMTFASNSERIDRWMETHKVQVCSRIPREPFQGGSRQSNSDPIIYHNTVLSCQVEEVGYYSFSVKDIEIEKVGNVYSVKNWAEPTEELTEYVRTILQPK